MARYIEANCRICRRLGDKLMLKGEKCLTPKCTFERRSSPPGAHSLRRRRTSDRGIQLKEKQKARRTYGVLERQFRRIFAEAAKSPGVTGEKLLELLERRLDNVIYRLGFADSRPQARQLVCHGHIILNGHKADIPSLLVKPGDAIGWRQGSTKTQYYQKLASQLEGKSVPSWLSLNAENLTAQMISLPAPADMEVKFNEKSIVEYYSR